MAKNDIDNLSEETQKGMLEKAAREFIPPSRPRDIVMLTDRMVSG